MLGKIAKKAFATLGCSADEFFEVRKQQKIFFGNKVPNHFLTFPCNARGSIIDFQGMGYYFVEFCALYGYGDVLALLGRCSTL